MTTQQTARTRRKSAPGHYAASITSGDPGKVPTVARTAVPVEQDSDWVRLPKPGCSLCGMTRSYLYQLCASGKIRSVTIRQKNNARGVRLVFRPSIDAFLAELDLEQNGAVSGANP